VPGQEHLGPSDVREGSALALTLDRQTLYDLVWSKPAAYLAADYGLSDVALVRLCRSLDVPKPPRGYWAKVKRGRKLPHPPLPPDSMATRTHVVVRPRRERLPRPEPSTPAPGIPVADALRRPHPLVAHTAAAFKGVKPDSNGLLFPYGHGTLRVHVSEATRDRALRIMDALLKALEQRGYDIGITTGGPRETIVTVDGERLAVRMREHQLRVPHVMTPDEKRTFLAYGQEPYWKFDHKPSGKLRIGIVRPDYRITEATFSDGKRRPLECQVGDIVASLESIAARLQREQVERAEAQRRYQEEARRREEERRCLEVEEKRFERLREDAAHWREAKRLRAYLRAVERSKPAVQRDPESAAWFEWAWRRVEGFDPLTRREK